MKSITFQATISFDEKTIAEICHLAVPDKRENKPEVIKPAVVEKPAAAAPSHQKPPHDDRALLVNIKSVAKLLSVGERTVHSLVKKDQMPPPIRFGASTRWSVVELEAWVAAGCPPCSEWQFRKSEHRSNNLR